MIQVTSKYGLSLRLTYVDDHDLSYINHPRAINLGGNTYERVPIMRIKKSYMNMLNVVLGVPLYVNKDESYLQQKKFGMLRETTNGIHTPLRYIFDDMMGTLIRNRVCDEKDQSLSKLVYLANKLTKIAYKDINMEKGTHQRRKDFELLDKLSNLYDGTFIFHNKDIMDKIVFSYPGHFLI